MYEEKRLTIVDGAGKVISKEKFKEFMINGRKDDQDLLDKAANAYDDLPSVFKVIAKAVDPTGIISGINDVLSEHRAQQQQERMLDALYFLCVKAKLHEEAIQQAIEGNRDEVAMITELYFQKCKESRQTEKIKTFCDIWFNGATNLSDNYDEKEYIFNLIETLTVDQIKLLEYIYSLKHVFHEHLRKYSEDNRIEHSYLIQMCIGLQGKGLIEPTGTISSSPSEFRVARFTETMIGYLK